MWNKGGTRVEQVWNKGRTSVEQGWNKGGTRVEAVVVVLETRGGSVNFVLINLLLIVNH